MAKNENTRMPAKINAFTAIIGTARGDSSFAILCLRLGLSFEPSFFAASILFLRSHIPIVVPILAGKNFEQRPERLTFQDRLDTLSEMRLSSVAEYVKWEMSK